MKSKLVKILILTLCLALLMTVLAGCKDKDGDKDKGNKDALAEAQAKVSALSNSTDEASCEANIGTAIGVNLNLPEGTAVSGSKSLADIAGLSDYAAHLPSFEGMTSYYVQVSGTTATETSYYNGIKATMIAAGYTADDDSLGFYKTDGVIVYALAVVEISDGELVVVASVIDSTKFTAGGDGEGTGVPALSAVETRIAGFYPGFTFSATGITVSSQYIELPLSGGCFGIYFSAANATVLQAEIIADFDRVVDSFGYTKSGTTNVTYNRDSFTYIQVMIEDGEVYVNFPKLPATSSVWPTAAIAGFCGANRVPDYVASGDDAEFGSFSEYGLITVTGTTEAEITAYQNALTTAGYTYDGDEECYVKYFDDGDRVEIYIEGYSEYDRVEISIDFRSAEGALSAWPSASLAADFAGYTLPRVEGATSFDYDKSYFENGRGAVYMDVYGVDSTENATYIGTTLPAAAVRDNSTTFVIINATAGKKLVIDYEYDADMKCLTLWLSLDEYVVPDYTKLPANFKLTYTDDGETHYLYCVDNDWYYTSGSTYYYIKYDATSGNWTRYAYDNVGDVAWTERTDVSDLITTANFDDQLSDYWDSLFYTDVSDEFEAGTKGTDTIEGIACNTYAYEKDYDVFVDKHYLAISTDGNFCLKDVTERYYGGNTTPSLTSGFVVTEFLRSGVTMPTDTFPVPVDAPIAWPAAKLTAKLGDGVLPAFSGDATMYSYVEPAYGYVVRLGVSDVSQADYDSYRAALVSSGYTLIKESYDIYYYVKNFADLGKTFTVETELSYGDVDIDVKSADYTPSAWPKAAVDAKFGTDVIPSYVSAIAGFSALTDYDYVSITNTTAAEADTYKQSLLDAGFTVNEQASTSSMIAYVKVVGLEKICVNVSYDGNYGTCTVGLTKKPIPTWPTESVAELCGAGNVPDYVAADPTLILYDGSAAVAVYNTTAAELETYKATLVTAGYEEQSNGTYVKTVQDGSTITVTIIDSSMNVGTLTLSFGVANP